MNLIAYEAVVCDFEADGDDRKFITYRGLMVTIFISLPTEKKNAMRSVRLTHWLFPSVSACSHPDAAARRDESCDVVDSTLVSISLRRLNVWFKVGIDWTTLTGSPKGQDSRVQFYSVLH